MTQSIVSIDELRQIAHQHVMKVVESHSSGGDGELVHRELLREFQHARQPFLSDKQYTALYRTYADMVVTAIKNYYEPGSATENPPVQICSIRDGDEIYRPNVAPMKPAQWEMHTREVIVMAERFAHEIAVLARTGGDVEARMQQQQYEAAKFDLDRGLSEEEMETSGSIYKAAMVKVLDQEANTVQPIQK